MKTSLCILAQVVLVSVTLAGGAAVAPAERVLRTDRLYVVGLPARAEIDMVVLGADKPTDVKGETGFVIVPAPALVAAEVVVSESAAAAKAAPSKAPAEPVDALVERPAAEPTVDVAS